MSQNVPNMMEKTIAKVKELVDTNVVVGEAIHISDRITIIPISTISVGFAGGGADFGLKNANGKENPFGGGAGGGVKVTPVAFMVIKDDNVRLLPMATPANTAADRLVEMIPDTLDRITDFVESYKQKKAE
jgi:sporulation protein YtfJ